MATESPALRLVFWETTQACNLACRHCRASAVSWRDPQELTFDEARSMMDDMVALGRPVLVFSGGEPLLRPDIFELMDEARGRNLPYALSTNGTLLTPDLADKVARARPHRVSVSIDGPDAATHDSFRQSEGAFDATLKGVRLLRSRGVAVQVNTSVTTHNQGLLAAIHELVKREEAAAWHLFMLVPVGCGLQIPAEQRLAAGQYERALRWFVERQAVSNIEMKATCAPHVVRIARQLYPRGRALPVYPTPQVAAGRPLSPPARAAHGRGTHPSAATDKGCLAGRGVCFVSRFGQVQGCGYLPIPAGNLRTQRLDEIWRNSEFFGRLRQSSNLKGKCGDCDFKSDCMGCRARAFAVSGDPFAEEPHCAWVPAARRPAAAEPRQEPIC